MCGITGVLTHAPCVGGHLKALFGMTALMRRRGPDDEGTWTEGEHAAFGFRRLAILDLSPQGHQPMESRCGRYVLVFNGEVYNFRELRRQLEAASHLFRSTSDTEVVLAALSEWGEAALPRFNGMYALAWYDRTRRRLLLARDPLGIKPLYYASSAEGLVFGSQYDQVIRHPFCTRRLVPEHLGLFLRLGYIPTPYALFEGTHLLPPGHYLTVEVGEEPRTEPFYSFPDESERVPPDEAPLLVEQAVGEAVRRQMISDVPLGAFLSGGVDSPLVAGNMRQFTDCVRAFTVGCTDERFDEEPVARAYAEALRLDHVVDTIRPESCLELVQEGARAYSEPFGDFSSLPSLLLCRSTRRHVTVALSGDGGDELFWGYPRFWKIAEQAAIFRWPTFGRMAAFAFRKATGRPLPRGVLFPDPGAWQLDGQCFSGLRDRDVRALCGSELYLPDDFIHYTYDGPLEEEALARWLRRNEIWGHLQMVLLKMDRASMHFSLEVRVPLLDLEVVQAAARVAPETCIRDGVGKLPLRKALARLVPPRSIPQRKAGFTVPLGDWLRSELRPMVEDLLLLGDPYPAGFYRKGELQRLYERHLAGEDLTRAIWHLLSLQLWAREHLASQFVVDGAAASAPSEVRKCA